MPSTETGERFSFSPSAFAKLWRDKGEKAGMRASDKTIQPDEVTGQDMKPALDN